MLAAEDIGASMRALLHAFLDLATKGETRMRDVLATHSLDALLQRARQHGEFALMRDDAALLAWHRAASPADLRLGAHALHADCSGYVGAQPALGRIDAPTLRALAALAQDSGDATLRVTPWQGVLLPNVAAHAMPAALERLRALGLVVSRADPLARLIACTGSTGCAKSRADTKADAQRLVALLPPDVEAHLTGCERSCAAAHCAPFTLLASTPDHYDLYQRDDTQSGCDQRFGQLIARNLTIEAAALALAQRPRSTQDV